MSGLLKKSNLNQIKGTRDDDVIEIDLPSVPDSYVRLGRGDDFFSVNTGNHTIKAGRGDDTVLSGDGDDDINGGRGDDHIDGGDGDDNIHGGRNDDYILGGNGNDDIKGGRGNDELNGNAGDDIVNGGRGDDILRGGEGYDELHGGRGEDVFVHVAGDNTTEIFDFQKGHDLIKLDFEGVDDIGTVLNVAEEIIIEEDTIEVVVDANNTLIVHGLGQDDVPDLADYFIF